MCYISSWASTDEESEQIYNGEAATSADRVNEKHSESEFSFKWCEAFANSYNFQNSMNLLVLLMKLSQPNLQLIVFICSLLQLCYQFLLHKPIFMLTNYELLNLLHQAIFGIV